MAAASHDTVKTHQCFEVFSKRRERKKLKESEIEREFK